MIAGNVTLKVTPGALLEKAELAEAKLAEMRRTLEILEQTMERTRGYWLGSAGELYRAMYEEEKEEIAEIMLRLQEHPQDLRRFAGVYREVEREVDRIADSLSAAILT